MIQMLSWMRYVTIYFNLYEIFSLNNLLMWVNYMLLIFMPFFLYPMLHVVYYVKPKNSGFSVRTKLKL